MEHHVEWPPKGLREVPGVCPNAGHACNCIGRCKPILVKEDDPRTDEQVRYENSLTNPLISKML